MTRRTKNNKQTPARRAPKSRASRDDAVMRPLENLVGYRLRMAYYVQVQRFAAVGGPLDIRAPQFAVLKLVHSVPGLKQNELTVALSKKHANIVTLLVELEARNLIKRSADPTDKRSRLLNLTAKGRKLTETLLERHARLERDLLEKFGARKRKQLIELLDEFAKLESNPNIENA